MQKLLETLYFLIELSCTSNINSMQYCVNEKETCIVKLFECQLKRGVVFRSNTLEYFLIKTIL